MNVRLLLPTEAVSFQALRLRGLREEPSSFGSTYEEEVGRELADVAAGLEVNPDRATLGLFEGSRLIGLAGVERGGLSKQSHRATIWGVYVVPEARGCGAGRVLLQGTMAQAYALPGIRQLYLSVQDSNLPARRLYESLGFEAIGVERGFMIVDGVPQDELHMAHYGPPLGG